MKNKKVLVAGLVLIVVLFLGLSIKSALNNSADNSTIGENGPKNGISVEIFKVSSDVIVKSVTADGILENKNKWTIYSPNTAKVESVNFDVGDIVKKGDVLITYSTDDINSLNDELTLAKIDLENGKLALESIKMPVSKEQLLQQESQLRTKSDAIEVAKKQEDQVNLQLEIAKQTLNQSEQKLIDGKTLFSNGIISKSELDLLENEVTFNNNTITSLELDKESAIRAINSAEESYKDTQAQINILKNKNTSKEVLNQIETQKNIIEKLNLRIKSLEKEINEYENNIVAEHDSVILTKTVEAGSIVQKNSALFTLASTDKGSITATVNVIEFDSGDLDIGQKATITGDALGKDEIVGTVTKIYPTVEEKLIGSSNKKVVVAEIGNLETTRIVRSGITIKAEIITSTIPNATVVPLLSLATDEDGKDYVFVVKDDFTIEKRIVEIGEFTGTNIEVYNVSENEIVIVNPSALLKEGDFVKFTNLTTKDE